MSFVGCLAKISHPSGGYKILMNNNSVCFELCRLQRDFSRSGYGLLNQEEKEVCAEEGDQLLEEQQRIEKLRNKSKLKEEHRNIMLGQIPYAEPKAEHHLTVRYNRNMFGKYGLSSGVNPGIAWPTKEDLKERLEYEKVAYPSTIQELVENAKNNIQRSELIVQRTHSQVVANIAKLHIWKKELQEKIAKREAEALAVKQKKEKLVEEVRRHFGYKIDPRDEKFKEMLTLKEKEQKKKEKLLKMEEREKKAIAKLMSKNEMNLPQSQNTKSDENL